MSDKKKEALTVLQRWQFWMRWNPSSCLWRLGVYVGFKTQALQRIALRDADDWPVLACAMAIGCPVWTEDADFFGTGVATWTSDRVELYLAG